MGVLGDHQMPVLRDALLLGSGLAEGMRGVMRSTGAIFADC